MAKFYYYRSDDYVKERIAALLPRAADSESRYQGHYCGSCIWYERGWCNMHCQDENYTGHECDSYGNGYENAVAEVQEPRKGFTSFVIDKNFVYGVK